MKLKICAQSKLKWCLKKLQGRYLITIFSAGIQTTLSPKIVSIFLHELNFLA